MTTRNEYDVTLTYLRSSKQPQYVERIEAITQAGAKLKAMANAKREGWKGLPVDAKAVIVRRVAA